MTRARPFHILTQDCPPNAMVEQNCLKRVKNIGKIFEKFRSRQTLSYLNQICKTKHLPSFRTTHHYTSKTTFKKNIENLFKRHTPLYTSQHGSLQRLPPHWPLLKTFSNPHTKHHFKQLKIKASWSKKVTKSPWITMDRKGANIFPFYNLLPEPKKTSQRFFAVLFNLSLG